jgi:hypothetical protein
MALKTIMEETTFEASIYSEDLGCYCFFIDPMPFSFVPGDAYSIQWDGNTYECTGQDGSSIIPGTTFVGNASVWGLIGNNEPFLMGGPFDGAFAILCMTDTEPTEHTVVIYHEEVSSGIIVKDRDGIDVTHEGVARIRTRTPDGGTKEFRDVDSIRIEPLVVTENGTYTAPDGVDGYSPVTVTAPEPVLQDKTITENGEYTADEGFDGLGKVLVDIMQNASSNGLLFKASSFKPESTRGVRVNLDIGFVPDCIVVILQANASHANKGTVYYGTSQAFKDKYGKLFNWVLEDGTSSFYVRGYSKSIQGEYDVSIPISAADETGFNLGAYAPFNAYYYCLIFGGLS